MIEAQHFQVAPHIGEVLFVLAKLNQRYDMVHFVCFCAASSTLVIVIFTDLLLLRETQVSASLLLLDLVLFAPIPAFNSEVRACLVCGIFLDPTTVTQFYHLLCLNARRTPEEVLLLTSCDPTGICATRDP